MLIGLVFFVLPLINKENDLLYAVSPWIYLSCFLYFTRTIEKKREWVYFCIIYLTACELRFIGFLGDSENAFNIYQWLCW